MTDVNLKKRLFFSAIFVSIFIGTIFFSPEWFFFTLVQAFSLFALNEYLSLAEKKNVKVFRFLTIFFGALIPFSAYYAAEPLVLMLAAVALFAAHFDKKNKDQAFFSTALSLFGILYVCCFFSHLVKIRHLEQGSALIFYVVLLTKGGDAGAYFVGKKYGKVKLIEHISPNKSVEGAVGGFVTTLVLSLISKIYLSSVGFGHLFILGILIGIFSQIGDLAESAIKRDVNVKDSGQVPGLGGILDMLDSLIFTVPLLYYYLLLVA